MTKIKKIKIVNDPFAVVESLSRYYSNDLSENIRRGIKAKKEREKVDLVNKMTLPEGFIARVQKYRSLIKEVDIMSIETDISNFLQSNNPYKDLYEIEQKVELYKRQTEEHLEWNESDKFNLYMELFDNHKI
ncbi:MAG: hypothetical protein K9L31_03035 [Candidatus Pacebacteria bacterium]|nr:hypothetical protein [Candidatus Paceibacterota bacterium]